MNSTQFIAELEKNLKKTRTKKDRARLMLSSAFADISVFAKYFFSEYLTLPFGKHHQTILNCITPGEQGKKINILAPRGSGKSVCLTVILPLHCLYFMRCYQKIGLEPFRFIVIVSRSEIMAISRVRDIKRKIDTSQPFNFLKSNASVKYFLCNNDEQLIVPKGRLGQIRGSLFREARPDLILTDDLDDPETVRNPDVRQKDQTWFDTDLIRAGRPDGKTNFINIDTVKHPESTANLLKDRAGWTTHFFQAIQDPADLWHPTHEQQWKQWEKMYTDMSIDDEQRILTAEEFYQEQLAETAEEPHIKHLWKKAITYYQIRKEICDVGYYAVLRELQNCPHDPSQAIFDMENAIQFTVTDDGLLRSDDRLVRWKQIAGGSVFLDWAGGKDNVDNAYAAAVCVLWEPMPGRRENASTLSGCHAYVLSVWMDKVKLSLQIENAIILLEDAQATMAQIYDLKWRLAIEDFVKDSTGAIGEYVHATYPEAKERRQTSVTLEFMPRYTNKIERIAALEPAITHGWLGFNKKLPPEYIKQMSLFPTADFMDGPDATEGACQLRVTEFPSVHRAKREQNRQRVRNFGVRL